MRSTRETLPVELSSKVLTRKVLPRKLLREILALALALSRRKTLVTILTIVVLTLIIVVGVTSLKDSSNENKEDYLNYQYLSIR